ncbi:MAG: selenocysteine-specific elongation factor [Gaiellaceae bacterium]|nr:selenocysteine-specific elongation factor [Gaiellaceae bacterium]
MPLTVGTAGHIDHGKTWLVRALTGKDTDRLPEERVRGISIDLGYAPLDLPDGRRLSLVDVPGHERFVRTMVAGATGIDLFLLVIDAAEGARPQTHEHLAILRLLGVERGVVAVTKADAVDAETVELAVAEARELAPVAEVVAVSAKTGAGLDELRAALARAAVESERDDAPTRLYVDRVFTLRGIGTVATGTLWSGRIAGSDALRIEPQGRDVRIRSVQVHDRDVDTAEAGQRVAVSLPGVERSEVGRGDVLVERGAYNPSYRLDVELEELAPIPPRVLVHHGTATMLARVVRAGRFAQLRLDASVVAARGDHVVLRAGTTVGGGRVIDPAPPRHADLERFERSARGEELVHAPVLGDDGTWRYSDEWLNELREELERRLDATDPLDPGIAAPTDAWAAEVVARLGFERRGAKLYRPGAEGALGEREHEAAELEGRLGLDPVKVESPELARFLEERGRLVRVGDGYAISPDAYARARELLVGELEAAQRITLARFRDLLSASRKTSQLLLERFDADGVTRRIGDERVLRASVRG